MAPSKRSTRSRLRVHPQHATRGSMPPIHAERLYEILGQARPCDEVSRLLRSYVHALGAPVVGAVRLTCSDEAEQENIEAFQRQFVRYLLPNLKFSSKSPFRVANLGGRYEWGSLRIAEDHYALARGADEWKILVVKISAHVAAIETPSGQEFGRADRYGSESAYCGALDAVLKGERAPFVDAITEDFGFEGIDRLGWLRDADRVPSKHRSLFAAVAHARLQARRAMLDAQDYSPASPTVYLILPCVTLNRSGHDEEILCGVYSADRRGASSTHDEYCGLGDLPWEYELTEKNGALALVDRGIDVPRLARNHRDLIREQWAARHSEATAHELARDDNAMNMLAQARDTVRSKPLARTALRTLIGTLAAASPISTALLLFGEGVVPVHHAAAAHKLAREAEGDQVARAMLAEVEDRLDALTSEESRHLVELLVRAHGG